MPATWKEGSFQGKPTFEVLTRFDKDGNPVWRGFGLATALGVLNNLEALKTWVAKQTGGKG